MPPVEIKSMQSAPPKETESVQSTPPKRTASQQTLYLKEILTRELGEEWEGFNS